MSYNCLQCSTVQTLNLTPSILSDDCNNPWRTINGTYHIFSFQKQNLFKSLFLERCQAPGVWIFWCYSALLTRMISKSLSKKSLLEKSIGQESTCVEQRWDFYWALEIEIFLTSVRVWLLWSEEDEVSKTNDPRAKWLHISMPSHPYDVWIISWISNQLQLITLCLWSFQLLHWFILPSDKQPTKIV